MLEFYAKISKVWTSNLAREARLDLNQEQKDQLNEITTFNQFARYDSEVVGFLEKCTPKYTQKYFNLFNSLRLWLKEFFPKENSIG